MSRQVSLVINTSDNMKDVVKESSGTLFSCDVEFVRA